MVATINASVSSSGIVSTADGSGILKVQSNGKTTNALAWVNFQGGAGNTAGAINAAYNVGSITVNGTGDYTLNFTNALSDANYAALVVGQYNANNTSNYGFQYTPVSLTTTSVRIVCIFYSGPGYYNQVLVHAAIFGN